MVPEQILEQQEVRSCCFHIDNQFFIQCVSLAIVATSLGLIIYKLIYVTQCEQSIPWYSLLSGLISLAGGALFHYRVKKNSNNGSSRNLN